MVSSKTLVPIRYGFGSTTFSPPQTTPIRACFKLGTFNPSVQLVHGFRGGFRQVSMNEFMASIPSQKFSASGHIWAPCGPALDPSVSEVTLRSSILLPSAKPTKNYGKSHLLIGKSNMAIYNSYLSLTEGSWENPEPWRF